MTFDFYAFVTETERRKLSLGVDESPAAVEAMRNKGERRTPEKRALLRRADRRAHAVGRTPILSYY